MSYFCRTHQVQRWEKQDMIATKMCLKKRKICIRSQIENIRSKRKILYKMTDLIFDIFTITVNQLFGWSIQFDFWLKCQFLRERKTNRWISSSTELWIQVTSISLLFCCFLRFFILVVHNLWNLWNGMFFAGKKYVEEYVTRSFNSISCLDLFGFQL